MPDPDPAVAAAAGAPPATATDAPPQRPPRMMALDVFRGLTILGMLLVNNIALDTATPAQLVHAGWNAGLTFADLVFPWFLLAVGVAIPYSAASARRRHMPIWQYDLKVLSRAATLVLLGCLIDSSIVRAPYFDLGVLQLIGLAYLVAALLYELPALRRGLLAAMLLSAYWAIIRFLPIPGAGTGLLTPQTNIINHLNQTYLAPFHLNGLLSVIPTGALVLIGTALGDVLRGDRLPSRKVALVLGAGAVLALVGIIWSHDLPFNKPLWTTSYVLYSSGLGALLLGFLYLILDVNGWRAWALPLVVLGMNAIFVYVVPILVKVYILQVWTWKLADGSHLPLGVAFMHYWFEAAGRIGGGWGYTLSYIAFWWLVAAWLYRKKIFLRV
ncbi:heparan-alpha-glucosaminide N-acetyltransferase domain-containing protein [bacterium]|nr:heparan-alpha-glucosaminide N-acetyltransferase domain-containing protein [bacterium]